MKNESRGLVIIVRTSVLIWLFCRFRKSLIVMPTVFHSLDTKTTQLNQKHLIVHRFSPFNSCLRVLSLDKGNYPENSQVVFCPGAGLRNTVINYAGGKPSNPFAVRVLCTIRSRKSQQPRKIAATMPKMLSVTTVIHVQWFYSVTKFTISYESDCATGLLVAAIMNLVSTS